MNAIVKMLAHETLVELDNKFGGPMQWQIFHGHFQRVENDWGDTLSLVPESYAEYPGNEDAADAYGVEPENVTTEFGYFCRLSAPGYMDCTDWSGPFQTAQEAAEELLALYGDE